jgi:hypothetical protein
MCCFVPLVKLSQDRYLFGTESKVLSLRNDKLFARIGGGFELLENVLYENALMEVIKLQAKVS